MPPNQQPAAAPRLRGGPKQTAPRRQTPEPPVPRFVILRHEMPAGSSRRSHFDLMFEIAGGLRTWAVDRLPTAGGPPQAATPLPLHRIAYLDYEGPVSGRRGAVRRVATGRYELLAEAEGRTEMRVASPEMAGRLVFDAERVWLLPNPIY